MTLPTKKDGSTDYMLLLVCIVTTAAAIKFVLDGVDMTVFGHHISFGHNDPLSYGSVLTPVHAAHSYTNTRNNTINPLMGSNPEIDPPDAT